MRDSGVECLGKVPNHWEVWRLGRLGSLLKGNGGSKDDEVEYGIPCIRYGDLYTTHQHFIEESRSFISEESACRYTSVQFGDVLFAVSGETIPEIGKSAVNLISSNARCGGDIILFRPLREFDARFLGYLLDCRPISDQKAVMGRGITVMHIYGTQLKYLLIPLPPPSEQTAIVRFLDHVDRRIQRYIRAKEKLIVLLEEQKQAIVYQAVTGRIDVRAGRPYPAYKPSGVEWLGDVPAHWEEISLGATSLSIQTGPFGSQLHASDYMDDGIPVINPSNIHDGLIHANSQISVTEGMAIKLSRYALLTDDIVVARRGEVGRCALVSDAESGWICGTGSLRIRLNPDTLLPSYLVHILNFQGVRDALHLSSIGSTMQNLNAGIVSRLRIILPSLAEQENIVDCINETTTKISDGIVGAQRQIGLVREYRTRLVADVVTGKVDVRSAAVELLELEPITDGGRLDAIQDEADFPIAEGSIAQEAS
ncbi:MAG: restriction endonuclease subunit S [Gemmatimonadetes bacterium]|nr:restriction endonuclease subunit S [Gemmatimonadota bacterium]